MSDVGVKCKDASVEQPHARQFVDDDFATNASVEIHSWDHKGQQQHELRPSFGKVGTGSHVSFPEIE